MNIIYCDNSSTSFPKSPGLGKTIGEHIDNNGYNVSRGGYRKAYELENEIIQTRQMLCSLCGIAEPRHIVFDSGSTAALNVLLKGVLKKGDHIITSSMEHNSVVRPLTQLTWNGVLWDEAVCDENGVLDIESIKKLIKPETKMILLIHGSNVCGTIMPVREVGKICAERNIFFAVDASQTTGSVKIDMGAMNADCLIFSGHKGLMGPQGIGCMGLSGQLADHMDPVILGGTGSLSESDYMPSFMPDKFQAGTMNIPGIIGLKHSLEFIEKEGIDAIIDKKKYLADKFITEILNIKGIEPKGLSLESSRCDAISVDFTNMDNAEAAFILERDYGILTRCGLHCAPHAHRSIGTFPGGTVRFSFGYFNTADEIDHIIGTLNSLAKY